TFSRRPPQQGHPSRSNPGAPRGTMPEAPLRKGRERHIPFGPSIPRGKYPMFGRKTQTLITEAEALPGRDEPLPVTNEHFVLHRPIKPPFPEGLETATFGMGCFWGAERVFWTLPGVYTTAAGYAGGYRP